MKKKDCTNKIISIMTECGICGKITTKKNFREGFYLCKDCNEFYSPEKIAKICKMLEAHGDEWNDEEIEEFLNQLYKLDD